ncbi:MAG: hypothetical protein JWN96_2091, partial [Mycobacterium sp.]|nr:hypothetical protein [Mycobacterium sp.]
MKCELVSESAKNRPTYRVIERQGDGA